MELFKTKDLFPATCAISLTPDCIILDLLRISLFSVSRYLSAYHSV
ncbi:MAG: hypothetical protein JW882_02070 [Deltaproteobacteria bacterium]|nr:hypothetical protein [Deltaproteobacteria bacterium]